MSSLRPPSKQICIYHSADLDGHCSGAIAKYFEPSMELIGYDYGQPFPWEKFDKDCDVIMVDVSLSPEDMKRLSDTVRCFAWVDHHKSAIDDMKRAGLAFPGNQRVGDAGCELMWEYMAAPGMTMPRVVQLLGSYDVWRFAQTIDEIKEEIWVPVNGHQDYEISQYGKIRSTDRFRPHGKTNHLQRVKGKVLQPGTNNAGYLWVNLKNKHVQLHRLVAEHFLIPASEYLTEVNHIDGDRHNNHVSNLEWSSRQLNSVHAVNCGLKQSSSKHCNIRYDPKRKKYRVRVSFNKERKFIGNFDTEIEAVEAYNQCIKDSKLCGFPYYYPLLEEDFPTPPRIYTEISLGHEDVLPCQYGMRMQDTRPSNQKLWCTLLENESSTQYILDSIIADGEVVLRYRKQQNASLAYKKSRVIEWEGYRALVINHGPTNSKIFDSIYDPDKHDIMMTYWQMSDGRWRFSVYTAKTEMIDCGALAKRHGGGGHQGAAGFITPFLPPDFH